MMFSAIIRYQKQRGMHMISYNKNSKKKDDRRMQSEGLISFRAATIPITLAAKVVVILAVALFFSTGSGSDGSNQPMLGGGLSGIAADGLYPVSGNDHAMKRSGGTGDIEGTITLPAELTYGPKPHAVTHVRALSGYSMENVGSVGFHTAFADRCMFYTSSNLKQ
jgi:hypothetical protein